MRKAYVKPVFLAEAFEGTQSVAACRHHSGSTGGEVLIYNTLRLCSGGNSCNHKVGGNKSNELEGDIQEYWSYATNGTYNAPSNAGYTDDKNNGAYLFTDGQVMCDFVWNGGNSQVGIWTEEANNKESAIWDLGSRNLKTSFITWISNSFSSFFAINGNGSDEHKPGVDNAQFFS